MTNTTRVRQVLSRIKKNGSHYTVKKMDYRLPCYYYWKLWCCKSEKEKAWQDLFQLLDTVNARNAHIPVEEADVEAEIREARRGH